MLLGLIVINMLETLHITVQDVTVEIQVRTQISSEQDSYLCMHLTPT